MLGIITKGGKEITLSAATETSTWARPDFVAEAIKAPFEQAVQAYAGPLPSDTKEICARESDHMSEGDSRDHFTGVCLDSKGNGTTVHFPVAKTYQPSYPVSQQAPIQQTATSATPQWVWDKDAQKYKYWNGSEWIWQ